MSTGETYAAPMRWRDYVLFRASDVLTFWNDHLGHGVRNVLYILGKGFDPRTCLGLQAILGVGGQGKRDVIALEYIEGELSPSAAHIDLANGNWQFVQNVMAGRGSLTLRPIVFRTADGRRSASRHAADLFSSTQDLGDCTDVVVDISAMPRGIFFPLIARLLYLLDEKSNSSSGKINLHVVVAEDAALDAHIREEGVDETAGFLHSFEGRFKREASAQHPKVWIPLLGEARTTQFDRLYDHVKPDEVCPVVPSPSRFPRRGDDIVMEYRDLLFDQLRIDPRNIIYASEENPFEVYRKIRQAACHYHRVLGLLGGCKIALSILSSKLMSLGALLVAYEMKPSLDIGVAHIECQGYALESRTTQAELVSLWLSGECYEA